MESGIPREKEDEEVRFLKEGTFFELFLLVKKRQSREMRCRARHLEMEGSMLWSNRGGMAHVRLAKWLCETVCGSDDGVARGVLVSTS